MAARSYERRVLESRKHSTGFYSGAFFIPAAAASAAFMDDRLIFMAALKGVLCVA